MRFCEFDEILQKLILNFLDGVLQLGEYFAHSGKDTRKLARKQSISSGAR